MNANFQGIGSQKLVKRERMGARRLRNENEDTLLTELREVH